MFEMSPVTTLSVASTTATVIGGANSAPVAALVGNSTNSSFAGVVPEATGRPWGSSTMKLMLAVFSFGPFTLRVTKSGSSDSHVDVTAVPFQYSTV